VIVIWLSDSEESDSSDDDDNVNDDSEMRNGTWTKLGAERLRYPFSGKTGLNVVVEDPKNLLVYSELLITLKLLN
jgi:hypothetical protein